MIEAYVEQDIGSYQSKFIGPLTFRQTVCLSVGVTICWAMYQHLTPLLSRDAVGFLVAIPAFLCAAIGWCRPYGMKTEQYLKALIFCRILYPRKLQYKVVNIHEKEINAVRQKDFSHDKHTRKQKYKVSPEAVR